MGGLRYFFVLMCLSTVSSAARMRNETDADLYNASSLSSLKCSDYCVQCGDGSTVWYGRSRNWVKGGVSALAAILTSGISLPFTAAVDVYKKTTTKHAGTANASSRETHTSVAAFLPTTGFMCERVDVIKFPPNSDPEPLLLVTKDPLARSKGNLLKPYDSKGKQLARYGGSGGFDSDKKAYTACKIVKSAGMKGAYNQFVSGLQGMQEGDKFCKMRTTRSIHTCSEHSLVCGNSGGVSKLLTDATMESCQASRKNSAATQRCENVWDAKKD